MMLKNSLQEAGKPHSKRPSPGMLAQMEENGKRRLWLFALLSFVLLLCYPLFTALTLSRVAGESLIIRQGIGHSLLGIDTGPTVALVTMGGILCAMDGFSWIYSRKKIDMYLSQPITAGRRFLMTYLNGILIYFVPYIISLVLALLVISGSGAASAALFVNVLFTLPASFVYFLAVYNVTLTAMMISGRRGMAVFFILTGFLYDLVLRATLESYAFTYFSTYLDKDGLKEFLSPVFRMVELCGKSTGFQGKEAVTVSGVAENMIRPMLPGLFILLLEAVVFGLLAYSCYKKRPMESAARAVAFEAVKGPVKVLLMLLSGLLCSACFCSISDNDGVFVALSGLLLGILVCQVFMEAIYEGDLRAFARHRKSFAAGAAAALSAYLFFALDISGYDTWVPSQEQVESAAIQIDFDNRYHFDYVDEKGAVTWKENDILDTMELTDVSGVLSLAKDGMGKNAREQNPDTQLSCEVKYRLKSGKEKYRTFQIDYEQEKTVLDILFANEAYKEGANQVLSGRMDQVFERSRVYYDNGLQETEIVDKNALPLMRAYQADLREMSFSDIKDAVPCGMLRLRYKAKDREEYELEYPVFPSYRRTVEYLRGKSIELYLHIDPVAVESINTRLYQETEDEKVLEPASFFGASVSRTYTADITEKEYTGREQIGELLGYLYPSPLTGWCYIYDIFDQDISVEIRETDREEAWPYHLDGAGFVLKKGELPEFVKEDLRRE